MVVHTRSSSVFHPISRFSFFLLVLLCAVVAVLPACVKNDLYAQCNLKDRASQAQIDCAASNTASCAFDQYLACETRVCAKFKASEPFCSIPCKTDADCKNGSVTGTCVSFFPGYDKKYCVSSAVLKKESN